MNAQWQTPKVREVVVTMSETEAMLLTSWTGWATDRNVPDEVAQAFEALLVVLTNLVRQ